MISENEDYIYINDDSINSLIKLKNSRYGSNSNIYFYNDNLLKILNYPISIKELRVLEKLKTINISNISIPLKFIVKNEQIFGYSMKFLKGNVFMKINERIIYDDMLKGLNDMQMSIKAVSLEEIVMNDLNCFNILYNECDNKINIVDVDNYTENNFLSKEEIYLNNIFYFEKVLLFLIASKNKYLTSNIYKELEERICISINREISILDTFKEIKDVLENYGNKEINTIRDFRKILKKSSIL